MSDFPDLAAPWSRVALVNDSSNLFDPTTMGGLDARYWDRGPIPAGTNMNNFFEMGRWRGINVVNGPMPANQWFYFEIYRATADGSYCRQTAYHFIDPTRVFNRVRENGAWTAWRQFAFV
jgi:hypothetical protein